MALPEFRYTAPGESDILNHYYGHGRNTMKNWDFDDVKKMLEQEILDIYWLALATKSQFF
jgi:hypothetical protein